MLFKNSKDQILINFIIKKNVCESVEVLILTKSNIHV